MKGNFKVRCVNTERNHFYTVGKTYEFKDGFMVHDLGEKFPYKGMDSFKEWQDFSSSKWELVTDTKEITIKQKGRKVIAVMTEDGKYVKSANAKCSPTDEFDFNIGAKLAFQRLMGETTIIVTNPNDKALPSIREVKRPAKVGEWIKIVEGSMKKLTGQICEVVEVVDGEPKVKHEPAWYTKRYDGDLETTTLSSSKYVVLENYQPEAKPFFSQSTIDEISRYTDKELINELSRRWEDKQ